jgi:hypothetical protein
MITLDEFTAHLAQHVTHERGWTLEEAMRWVTPSRRRRCLVPINRRTDTDPTLIYTLLSGRVTDQELRSYYEPLLAQHEFRPWRELVDGTQVTEMMLTPAGLMQLAELVEVNREKARGGRVAMVATTDITYGTFRMWELRREALDYEVRVFRDLALALAWL